jgi:hypothetical protein
VSPEWQLDDFKPVPDADCGFVLLDVAERANEVIPVQHRRRASLPALISCVSVSMWSYNYASVLFAAIRSIACSSNIHNPGSFHRISRRTMRQLCTGSWDASGMREF